MKLIVVDLDRLRPWPYVATKGNPDPAYSKMRYKQYRAAFRHLLLQLNETKVCTLLPRDFGKKTLMKLPKGNPKCLAAYREYSNAIFKLKDDDDALKHENRMFRKIFKEIQWFRVGVILRRGKAVKILARLLKIS